MTPMARAIAEREAHAISVRERMRARWSAAAAQRTPPPPDPILPRVVVPLGPDAEVAIRNRVTFKFGPLKIVMARFDEALISSALFRLQAKARSWPDGTMRGIKRLIRRGDAWVSPSQGTVWKGDALSAEDFDEEGALRGNDGIHAVWVDKLDELNSYEGRLVEIAGWGQCTVGDLGWRAQHAKVVRELI